MADNSTNPATTQQGRYSSQDPLRIPLEAVDYIGTSLQNPGNKNLRFVPTHLFVIGVVRKLGDWSDVGCWATDCYLAGALKVSERRVRQLLHDCGRIGFIENLGVQEFEYRNRTYTRRILRTKWCEPRTIQNVDDEVARLRALPYAEYLQSDHWRGLRRRLLSLYGYACVSCHAANTILDVHHLTYARLGRELTTDLQVLCRKCHDMVHGVVSEGRK